MNDEIFARRVAGHLSAAARQLDPSVCERLRAARALAVGVRRGPGLLATLFDHALRLRMRLGFMPALRSAGMAMVVLLVFMAGDYWATVSRVTVLQEVDAALLMDDLPIEAYLDQDFRAWLSRESQS